jgi:hypothetical protein
MSLVVGCTAGDSGQESAAPRETSSTTTSSTTTSTSVQSEDPQNDAEQVTTQELAALRSANDFALPREAGLDLFASVFGPVPGADVDRFAVRPGDGTLAIRAVLRHWEALTDEQHAAIRAHLGYAPTQGLMGPRSPEVPQPLLDRVTDARTTIAAHVGTDIPYPIAVEIGDTGDDLGWAIAERAGQPIESGAVDNCRVVFPSVNPSQTTVAHEVFHCFQHHLTSVETVVNGPDWIFEGSAEWVGSRIGGADSANVRNFDAWVTTSQGLFSLDYAAAGFFWTIESMGVDPWTVMTSIMSNVGEQAVIATGLEPQQVLTRMATFSARRAVGSPLGVSDVWDFATPGVPDRSGRSEGTVTPAVPYHLFMDLGQYAKLPPAVLDLVGGDMVTVRVQSGVGALEFEGGDLITWTELFEDVFCIRVEGCSCGVGEAVDSGLAQTSRTMIVTGANQQEGVISLRVTVDEIGDTMGFSDGHWEGEMTTWYGDEPVFSEPFYLVVADGVVVEGEWATSAYVFLEEFGTGLGTIRGTFHKCGFNPCVWMEAVDVDLLDGSGPERGLTFRPFEEGDEWLCEHLSFDVFGPDVRGGQVFGAGEGGVTTFEARRTR